MSKRFLLLITVLALFTFPTLGGTTHAQGTTYQEAPMLADLVKAGKLPSVDKRLPDKPVVVDPVEEVGQYGGTWHMLDADNTLGWTRQTIMVEPFLKWKRDASGFRPNLLEKWEWNSASTELVAHFVKGIKWSDGQPLTVDDYLFWWNDMVMDKTVNVAAPSGTTVGGKPMTVAKVDDYTLKFTFAAPNPLFLEYHSRGSYHSSAFVVPAHYLKQFHPKYNTAVKDATELLNRYDPNSRLHYPDMPTFDAWKVVSYQADQLVQLERNPYYWKVDSKGNQLPYIDKIEIKIASGVPTEQVALNAVAGKLDMQVRDVALKDVPLVKQNAQAGGYRVIMWNRGDYAWPWIIPMYDYTDKGIVDLMYMPKFRQALSYAINRGRINDSVFLGLGKPRQFALSAESGEFQSPEGKAFYQKWVTSYANFDPDQAKKLLDGISVVDKNGSGFRQRPDGTALELIVDIPSTDTVSVDAMQLVKQDWEAVGLKTTLNITDGTIIDQRAAAGEIMIRAWGSAAAWGLISASTVWTPVEGVTYTVGGQRIGQYYQSNGQQGVAPRKGSMLEKLQQDYTKLLTVTDPKERDKLLLEAYQIHIDEGPITIGTVGEHPSPVIVKNNFHNVQSNGLVASWDLGYPGTADPEQFFIK